VILWSAVLVGALGCYLLKLIGLSVPGRVLQDERVQRIAALIPIALLTALMVTQSVTSGQRLVLDERAAGLFAAFVAVLIRAPFLVVVAVAAATTAGLRLII
jgi:branched-subunit amino acid transport protein